jgi:putative endonuclease
MRYYLYILKSKTKEKFYVGVSSNPQRRLIYHNSIEKGFTARYRPWEIVYAKEFHSKSEALKVERKIKRWKSRRMIELVIEGKIELHDIINLS